jgi:hypothetical protein
MHRPSVRQQAPVGRGQGFGVQTYQSECHTLVPVQAECFVIVQVPANAQQAASGSLVGHGVEPATPKPSVP